MQVVNRRGGVINALSILRGYTNRDTQDRLPRLQFVPPPSVRLLRLPFQHPGKARTLEPRGTQVAKPTPVAEWIEEESGRGTA